MATNSNAFEILGCKATITIETESTTAETQKYQIAGNNFIHYIRDEQYAMVGKPSVGISIPTAELKIVFPTPTLALGLVRADKTKVNVLLTQGGDSDKDTQIDSSYIVTNFDLNIKADAVEVTLYMLADLGDFISTAKIQAFGTEDDPVTSIKAIYEAVKADSMEVVTDEDAQDLTIKETYETNDKQIWIQGNIPTYQFIANTIKHCNPTDPDLILVAINHDKIKIVSYNATINKDKAKAKAYIYLSKPENESNLNTDGIMLMASNISLESSLGIYNYLLGVEAIPQVRMTANKETIFGKIANLIKKTNKPKEMFESERIIAPKFDCGNTHENYWNSQLANERKLAQIYRNLIYIQTDGMVLSNKLNILDTAYLNIKGLDDKDSKADGGTPSKVLDGNFVVLGISRYISQTKISNRISLGRAEY